MSDPSGDYRPFNDPHHPSWYSDRQQGQHDQLGGTGQNVSGSGSSAAPGQPQNPYAHQPLAGPYGSGQPQYPIDGQYPVVASPANPSTQGYGYDSRQSGQPHPYVGQAAPTTVLSIISMVCGIAGVVTMGTMFLPQLAAIVLGHIGLRREPRGRGFAIAGLVMGYVVTVGWILLILLTMMFAFSVPFMGM